MTKKGTKIKRKIPASTKGIKERDKSKDPKKVDLRIGNAFWQQRSRHGRTRLFKTPKLMWEAAMEYFKWCDDNPFKRAELVKYEGSAEQVEVDVKRPYSFTGVCLYFDVHDTYLIQFKNALKPTDPIDKEFSQVIAMIEKTVSSQQIDGAMSGFFNANIVSRVNSLVERSDVTTAGLPTNVPPPKVYTGEAPPTASTEDEIKP